MPPLSMRTKLLRAENGSKPLWGRCRSVFSTKIHAVSTRADGLFLSRLRPASVTKRPSSSCPSSTRKARLSSLTPPTVKIGQHPRRKIVRLPLPRDLERKRFHVELSIHHPTRFRALTARYEKNAIHLRALVHLACALRCLNLGRPPASPSDFVGHEAFLPISTDQCSLSVDRESGSLHAIQ